MRLGSFSRGLRGAGLGSVIAFSVLGASCAQEFDTKQRSGALLSLGDDLYAALCDRMAAGADPADLEGRKSRAVCHATADGTYANDYAEEDKPMPPKVAVMVRYRPQLIKAFNATFPDVKNPDGSSSHKDLQDLMVALAPLYDDDTLPESTRTLSAIFQTVFYDGKADDGVEPEVKKAKVQRGVELRAALARIGGRKGYRSLPVALGAARPVLAYEKLDALADDAIRVLGAGGSAEPDLRKVLEVAQLELATATLPTARKPITGYTDRFSGLANQKPKLTSEILRNLLVDAPPAGFAPTWADGYAEAGAATLPFLFRDGRGFASFTGLPAGAVDKDGDGLPDVDDFGRFVDGSKKPLTFASPFAYLEVSGLKGAKDPRDAAGRALVAAGGAPLYRYGDASRTMLNALLRDTKTLAAPATGPLLDFLHVGRAQFGDRVDATGTWDDPDHAGKKLTLPYKKFDVGNAPLADLVYAFGRFLALPKVDDYLELTKQLTRDHPAETARLLGAVMKLREIANKPEYAAVDLDDKAALWDELAGVAAQIAAEPAVLKDVLDALANDNVLLLPKGMALFAANKDVIDYNPAADTCWAKDSKPDSKCPQLNDPWFNVTGGGSKSDPKAKTDLGAADAETNRSLFQRFLSLMSDAWGVRACNRPGATINTKLGPISVKLPLFGTYDECEVLNVPDLAEFYLGCIAGGKDEISGKDRCKLPVTDGLVSALNAIIGSGNVDNLLEGSSGITGLKQTPTIEALNRLVMWRNPNKFVSDLTDPIPSNVCPLVGSKGTRKCSSEAELIRERQRGTIFMGEAFDALKGLQPVVLPFVKKRADGKGRERYFLQIMQILHRYWSPGGNPVRCVDGGTPASNPKFCYKSNARAYEGILAEAFGSDLLPALNAVSKTAKTMTVNGKNAQDVLASLVGDLLDPAKNAGLVDRKGSASTTFNDGRKVDQVTLFYLFANGINGLDARWTYTGGDKDHATWRAARSKIVDVFLTIDAPGGDFTKSAMRNKGVQTVTPILVDLIADRLAEHRAKGDLDAWAKTGLVNSFTETLSGPTFATAMDLVDKIYADEKARTSVQDLLVYLADQASKNEALPSVLTASNDLLQVLADDQNLVPLFHAFAVAAAPDGATKRSLDLLQRVSALEKGDFGAAHGGRRVLSKILANAVTPMAKGEPAPIEVFVDVVAEIHRADPTGAADPFAPPDYGSVAKNVHEFLSDKTRGLEQLYTIVKNRNLP